MWKHSAEEALKRAHAFAPYDLTFLEEPVLQEAIGAYREIVDGAPSEVPIAGGEGSDTVRQAEDFIVNGGASFVQIDQGRIGGLTSAYKVRQLCEQHGKQYVNHSFKSHLSIAAALHVFATSEEFDLMEFPQSETVLSAKLVSNPLARDGDGRVHVPEGYGLGVDVDLATVRQLLVPLTIDSGVAHTVNEGAPEHGTLLYSTKGLLPKTSVEKREERQQAAEEAAAHAEAAAQAEAEEVAAKRALRTQKGLWALGGVVAGMLVTKLARL
jgi:hypothetical protein